MFSLERAVADRSRAFRAARRHSMLVRVLRVSLPLLTLLVFASYGLFVQRAYEVGIGDGTLTIGPVALSGDMVTAENPRFEGFNKNGDRFVVTAKSAEHDLKRSGPIGLKLIEGVLYEQNKTVTRVTAPRGRFDTRTEVLELEERIEVTSNTGLRALLTRATVSMREDRIVSSEPVTVAMPSGIVRGNELLMLPKQRHAILSAEVTARFEPEERVHKGSAAGLGAGNAPIEVSANTLKVDDAKRLAVFDGRVRATQDGATLTAALLEIGYDGAPQSGTAPASAAALSGRINRIVARHGVIIAQDDSRATCDTAEFDPVADTALLTGTVVVTQGANVLKGGRLFLDRKSGTSELTAPARGNEPKGRITAQLHQGQDKPAPREPALRRDGEPALPAADPSAPIEIEADRLDVDDHAKTAVFRGSVVVRQGRYTLRTAELVASYSGESGLASGLQGQSGKSGQAMQLKTVRTRSLVHINSEDGQTARGEAVDFDVKSNIVTLIGDVVLTQGGHTVTGPRAIMNLNTGEAQVVPGGVSATGADAAVRSSDVRPGALSGRPSLLIYPNQLKDRDKAKQKGGENERMPSGSPATHTSGWAAETTPAAADRD
ncbi:MAG TPA: LPS export ABC transporter periplasmic protein LptC [Hyphomicrobiaceae bacterium]|nr:LPS export ABC transporter periplasmic protein LptC [Hyphomicrobiaceae bacterium]